MGTPYLTRKRSYFKEQKLILKAIFKSACAHGHNEALKKR
jgi:hypothetical protein